MTPKPIKVKSTNYYRIREWMGNYTFVVPALLLFMIFSVYPFYRVFELSVYEWDGISPERQYVGLAHFKDILFHNDVFWLSVKNAFIITLLALTVQNLVALLLALACDREIRFGNIYRVIFYLPPVLSGIVVGLIWQWIYDGDYGLLNHLLAFLRLEHLQKAWLADGHTALYAVAGIHMWKGFGWGFIVLLAGLQSIPRELYEAARVDGAGFWHTFRNVTLPLMIPVFILVSILTILGTMQIFDIIVSTTRGGPGYHTEVPITRMIGQMVGAARFGYASAMGIIFGGMLLAISLVQIYVSKKMRRV